MQPEQKCVIDVDSSCTKVYDDEVDDDDKDGGGDNATTNISDDK